MLGNKTTQEDIEAALLKMDKDGSGEVEQEEFAQWFRSEHADEHPAGPDVFLVTDRLEEMYRRNALPRPSAGDRDLALEIAVAMFGRCVDLLQFKRVVHFFATKERDGLYRRLGPLNAMNPMDPDGWWKVDLRTQDERMLDDPEDAWSQRARTRSFGRSCPGRGRCRGGAHRALLLHGLVLHRARAVVQLHPARARVNPRDLTSQGYGKGGHRREQRPRGHAQEGAPHATE